MSHPLAIALLLGAACAFQSGAPAAEVDPRAPSTVRMAERLEQLHFRQQRAEMTDAERAEMAALTNQYEWAMLIRAKAIEQLLARGHDVSGLLVP